MDERLILVKELCEKNSCICNFEGTLCTHVPIKEIYEVRHQILKPKVVLGEKAIALFGKILIKAYCINKESSELFLAEQMFNYKGFILGDFHFHNLNPTIRINSRLQGIFSDITDMKNITIDGIIATELSFSLEKELSFEEFGSPFKKDTEDDQYDSTQKAEECSFDDLETDSRFKEAKEFQAEIIQGIDQEITLILD